MDIYCYFEKNMCSNSGKPICFGDTESFIGLFCENEATAVYVNGAVGEFSGTNICLGDFDGVHKGHKALFDVAKKNGKWGVLLFDRNIKGTPLLTTQAEKLRIVDKMGADYVVIAEFCDRFSKRTPEEFVDFLADTLKVDGVIAGYDYRFGYRASGDAKLLEKICSEKNISSKIVESVTIDGEPVKSTAVRDLIKKGDMLRATELLGYPYFIWGKVEKGFENGRKMGFPTANISYGYEKLLPPDGVYRGNARGYNAVINIGKNPTLDAQERTVEVHLIGYDGDLYGEELVVEFYEKIRNDIKFKNLDELAKQIEKDVDYVKERM